MATQFEVELTGAVSDLKLEALGMRLRILGIRQVLALSPQVAHLYMPALERAEAKLDETLEQLNRGVRELSAAVTP